MTIKEITINRHNGGIAFDKRSAPSNSFGDSINFDIHATPSLLTPVRDYEADEGYGASSTGIKASDLAAFGQIGTSSVYAVGRKNDGTGRKIYNKSISSSVWLASTAADGSAAEAADGCAVPGFFIEQRDSSGQSLYWFVTGSGSAPTTSFWQLGLIANTAPTGPTSFSKKTLAFNPTIYPQAIVGKDGVVYVATGYKLHGCNSDKTVDDSVFTVSPQYTITSMCLFGNYLAIAIYGRGRSKVLLWDYNNAQASETIEWGEGALMVLDNLDEMLVGVTDKYINSTLFSSGANGSGTMQIKTWSGGFSKPIEVKAHGVVARAVEQFKYVKDGVLKWYAKIPQKDGTYKEGIWSFGQRQSSQPYALSLERQIAGSSFEGFWGISDYLYLPHSGDGSVSRTSSTETHTLTSVNESVIIGAEDPTIEKSAKGAMQAFEAFEDGQDIRLKYRKDGETEWTTLDPIPAIQVGDLCAFYNTDFNFREIEFRRESTNGAKLSEFRFRYEELTSQMQ